MPCNRLTVEQIKSDMAKTGMTLGAEEWFKSATCGCPMAIHAVANGVTRDAWEPVHAFCIEKFGLHYLDAFTSAFDDIDGSDDSDSEDERTIQGHEDGTTARKELPLVPLPPPVMVWEG